MAEKLEKITMLRGTIFDGAHVEAGMVVSVTDENRKDANYLVSRGRALPGAVKPEAKASTNKAISDLDTKKA